MAVRLLALALAVLGVFPQPVCHCAELPPVACPHCHHDADHSHHDTCPCAQPRPVWDATPPTAFVVPAADAGPVVGCVVEAEAVVGEPSFPVVIDTSPPHVPLFLSHCALRN